MTYTEHKLTDAMLQHLSATAKGRQVGGMSMRALEARGLVYLHVSHYGQRKHLATDAGREALLRARVEGW